MGYWRGDDSGWIIVGSAGAPAFTNSWVSFAGGLYGPPAFRKIGPIVYLRGYAGTGTGGTSMFTLPVGSRPGYETWLHVYNGSFGHSYIRVAAAGTVSPADGGVNGCLLECSFVVA